MKEILAEQGLMPDNYDVGNVFTNRFVESYHASKHGEPGVSTGG